MPTPILPGATIGIFGSGQLGRMLTVAAKTLGYRVHTYSPEKDTPTGQVADYECAAHYSDTAAVAAFVRNVDVVTFEFENVDAGVADTAVAQGVPVHPSGQVLRTAQNRIREKRAMRKAGLPVTPYVPILNEDDLDTAGIQLGFPLVLKTAFSGYDGKGQSLVADADELANAWRSIDCQPAVAEQLVAFEKEVSVVATRGVNGDFTHFGAIENRHQDHILDLSLAPARVDEEVASRAVGIAESATTSLDVVGTLCVEFFLSVEGDLLVNEIAPRPHNSGHLTIEAACTSQFEQHIRAICGLPLGSTEMYRAAAMANLLGDLWLDALPDFGKLLAHPSAKLHLYGKHAARPGRKMGHVTALAASVDEAAEIVVSARRALSHPSYGAHLGGGILPQAGAAAGQ